MTNTPLRVYNREIETLIDRGQTEEAIAHCLHILQVYPKHLETYRLLGKSFLESQRYTDAADIFQRVLAAVPDDFISHIGMSIVREDEGNLDAAIWHMERSYEVQPSNAAVQDELRRLYGRRDGVEPPRVRLTRGALVRMYARGNLYQQAIAEVKASLAEDPHRPDMLVLLASLYDQSGQRIEAAEACSQLLNKYPYCLEANRILAGILVGTERAEDAEVYQQRVCTLDPYAAFISTNSPSPSDVPDNAINVERLEYQPGKAPAPAQPQWAASLGIDLGETPDRDQETPDWLAAIDKGAQRGEVPTTPPPFVAAEQPFEDLSTAGVEPQGAAAEEQGKIPDWMQAAGWTTSTTPVDESQIPALEDSGQENLVEADIPDWLREMAPAGEEIQPPAETVESVPSPETSDAGLEPAFPAPSQPAPAGAEIPDWLQSEAFEQSGQAAEQAPAAESEAGLPDWVTGLGAAPSGEPAHLEEGRAGASGVIPDWLTEVAPAPETGAEAQPVAPAIDESAIPSGELPGVTPPAETTAPASPSDEEAGLAWLESLAAKHGADEETLYVPPEKRLETPPDWVQEAAGEAVLESAPPPSIQEAQQPDDTIADTQEVHVHPIAEIPSEEAEVPAPQEDVPDWLKNFTSEVSGELPSDRTSTPGETHGGELPDWIQAGGLVGGVSPESALPAQPAQEVPDWLKELQGPEAVEPPQLPEDFQQAADIGTPEALSPEEDLEEEMKTGLPEVPAPLPAAPDQMEVGAAEIPAIPPEEGAVAGVPGATDWMQGSGAIEETPLESALPAQPVEEVPDWLKELKESETGAGELEPPPAEALQATETPAQAPELGGPTAVAESPEATPVDSFAAGPRDLPDWIKQIDAETAAESAPQPAEAEQTDLETPQPAEAEAGPAVAEVETPPAETGAPSGEAPSPADQEAAIAWLEGLAARQGAEEEELFVQPEERTTIPPDWVKEALTEGQPEAAAEAEPPVPSEAVETGFQAAAEPQVEASMPSTLPAEAEAIPVQPAAEEIAPVTTEESGELIRPEGSPAVAAAGLDLPDWLKGVEAAPPAGQTAPEGAKEIPAWLQDMEEPAKVEEPEPPQEEAAAQELPEWLQGLQTQPPAETQAVAPGETAPEAPWLDMQAESAEESGLFTAEAPAPALKAEASGWRAEEAGQPPALPAAEAAPVDYTTLLVQAQTALSAGQLHAALQDYGRMIQANQFLDNVIFDLHQSVYQHPDDQELWQTLGDAYMRADRLQDALNAYTKAEELLQ